MDVNSVLNMLLPIVFSLVGVALIFLVIELIKVMKTTNTMLDGLRPKIDATMQNVEDLTTSIKPIVAKVDPMMDSMQLTLDAVNLEMMRVDQILEDLSEITDSASSATAAVDNITNAPIKAVNSMASRVRSAFGSKGASAEAAQLAEQRVAVAQALEDYKAAEKKDAEKAKAAEEAAKAVEPITDKGEEPESASDAPKSYVKEPMDGEELVIDPKAIAESPFFDDNPDEQ